MLLLADLGCLLANCPTGIFLLFYLCWSHLLLVSNPHFSLFPEGPSESVGIRAFTSRILTPKCPSRALVVVVFSWQTLCRTLTWLLIARILSTSMLVCFHRLEPYRCVVVVAIWSQRVRLTSSDPFWSTLHFLEVESSWSHYTLPPPPFPNLGIVGYWSLLFLHYLISFWSSLNFLISESLNLRWDMQAIPVGLTAVHMTPISMSNVWQNETIYIRKKLNILR